MRAIFAACLFCIAACVTEPDHSTSSLSDGSEIHTVRCEDSWDACYLAASRICGGDDFDELSRDADQALSSAGRLDRLHTVEGNIEKRRYSETVQADTRNRVITIRCNTRR